VTGSGVGWGTAGRVALTTRPTRTAWFQPGTRLLVGRLRPFHLWSGRRAGCTTALTAFNRRLLS
jgi:hypothetical protein